MRVRSWRPWNSMCVSLSHSMPEDREIITSWNSLGSLLGGEQSQHSLLSQQMHVEGASPRRFPWLRSLELPLRMRFSSQHICGEGSREGVPRNGVDHTVFPSLAGILCSPTSFALLVLAAVVPAPLPVAFPACESSPGNS